MLRTDIVMRRATPDDNADLIALAEDVWPVAYAYAGSDYAQHTIDTWWNTEANLRSIDQTTMLVAFDGEQIVGMGNIDFRPDVPIIWKLAVHPRYQGWRIGLALLEELIALANQAPVRLAYAEGNEQAARFYASYGFEPIGRNEPEQPGWPGQVRVEWRPRQQPRSAH